jgi:phage gp29-like protein
MAALVDRFGRPMASKDQLTQEIASATLTGVRQAWDTASAVAGLTPARLDAILRKANQGDLDSFLTLAEEMEERDPHYGSVLQTRKLAVMGLERKLTWAPGKEQDPRAEEILEACQELIGEPHFEDLVFHLLDAIAKGYAAPEIVWETTSTRWRPHRYEQRDPRWFTFDRETGCELRLKDPSAADGIELPPSKFVIHMAMRKSGLAARGGLARLVAFSFVCKLYGLKDWMAYAEIFGIPLRLGKYDAAARPEDVEVLKRAVFGLGSDAAAVIPAAMTIEFPNPNSGGTGADIFERLVTWCDNQVSKAVLGQTGTTDMQKGGGYAQSSVLNEVRGDLTRADARGIGATITSDLLAPFVLFNWGPDAPVPSCELVVEDPEDTTALSTALGVLVPLGLRVGQDEIRKKLGLSEPPDDAEVLQPAQRSAEPPPAVDKPARGLTLDRRQGAQAAPRTSGRGAVVDDELDEIQAVELDGWQKTFGPEAGAVMDLVRNATSFDQVQAGLEAMAKDLAAPPAARSLARAMFQAAVLGDGQVQRKG